jgi:hypothetical protein
LKVPPAGLEQTPDNIEDSGSSSPGAAKSAAFPAEICPASLTPEALAWALQALPPSDRARLAALLLGQQESK